MFSAHGGHLFSINDLIPICSLTTDSKLPCKSTSSANEQWHAVPPKSYIDPMLPEYGRIDSDWHECPRSSYLLSVKPTCSLYPETPSHAVTCQHQTPILHSSTSSGAHTRHHPPSLASQPYTTQAHSANTSSPNFCFCTPYHRGVIPATISAIIKVNRASVCAVATFLKVVKKPPILATHPDHGSGCHEADAEDVEKGWETRSVGWVIRCVVDEQCW